MERRYIQMNSTREELLEELKSSTSTLSDDEMQELIDYALSLINRRTQ